MSTSAPPLNDLVVKIRQMHPDAYDDMDDATLTKAVLAKYPQYSDLAVPKLQMPLPGALNPNFNPNAPSREETGGTSPTEALKSFGRSTAIVASSLAPEVVAGSGLLAETLASGASGALQTKALGGSNRESAVAGVLGAGAPLALRGIGAVANKLSSRPSQEAAQAAIKELAPKPLGPPVTDTAGNISRNIIGPEGSPIGKVVYDVGKDGTADIKWIGSSTPENADSLQLGPRAVRSMRQQLLAEHPEIQGFSGIRVSGSRGGEAASITSPANRTTTSLRDSLAEPIKAKEQVNDALYDRFDNDSGTNTKAINQKLKNINKQLRSLTGTDEDLAKAEKLENARGQLEQEMQSAISIARERGTPPEVLEEADDAYKQMSAMTDVERKVFKNPNIIGGNIKHGTPETVNIDAAVKALQKIQDDESYGAPRLEQAFGEEGAKKLLDKMYAAQRQGIHAMKMKQVLKWTAGIVGAGAATKAGLALTNH
jgi:hypothetical protein